MSTKDRVRWDEKFTSRKKRPYPAPDPLLLRYVPPAGDPAPRALDLAGGLGQNTIWLAEQGYRVDLADISRVALNRAREEMAKRGLRNINLIQTDFEHWHIDPDSGRIVHPPALSGQYGLLVVFRFLQRDLFPVLKQAVQGGGRVVYATFNQRHLEQKPDANPDYLLRDGELLEAFEGWRVIYHDEETALSQLVAVKPHD